MLRLSSYRLKIKGFPKMKEEVFDIIKFIVSVLAPIISSIFSILITNKYAIKLAERNFKHQLLLKDSEVKQEQDNKKTKETKKNKEIIINRLQYIRVHNSKNDELYQKRTGF